MSTIHDVRDHFSLDKFLKARDLTIEAMQNIQSTIEVGMTEEDGLKAIDRVLNDMGTKKKWHPNKFRIGKNTIKSFRDISDSGVNLTSQDLYFIDIGPIWEDEEGNGYEGDFGQTFTVGTDESYNQIVNASLEVFEKTADFWKTEKVSGADLYKFAETYANKLGYEMNTRMRGHRIGDFPHHLFYKGGMIEIEETPCDHLWVLEIHLIDKSQQFGAFYEDILQENVGRL